MSYTPLKRPVIMKTSKGEIVSGVKVDKATSNGREALLIGWATPSCTLQLWSGEVMLASRLVRNDRPDVAHTLKMGESREGFGFSLAARLPSRDLNEVLLRVLVTTASGSQQAFDYPIQLTREGSLLDVHQSPAIDATGELAQVLRSPFTGDLIVCGWLLAGSGADIWLETDSREQFDLDTAYRFANLDVSEAQRGRFGAAAVYKPSFLMRCPSVAPTRMLRLVQRLPGGDEVKVLDQVAVEGLELDPVMAGKRLFAIASPLSSFAERAALVDGPVLGDLLANDRANWPGLAVKSVLWGGELQKPLVTVVVPLYGRIDFVEHQLLEFARDPWFLAHAQLVYVLDDERLVDALAQQAEQWFKLYGVPFEWVFGGVNRGYSGANNLGASRARGASVLFLNSDAVPLAAGWLEPMCQALVDDPKLGIVGARLLFPDGSLQHAGMRFERREDLGVWINHHPLMGCPPALDTAAGLTRVPAVTGACMAIRRSTLEAVGGWDTGYLVGDFEDSDLCFKVRAQGLEIGYLPTVVLTHLERQSFKLLGQGDFRQRVVVFNAARHQARWGEQIAALQGGCS